MSDFQYPEKNYKLGPIDLYQEQIDELRRLLLTVALALHNYLARQHGWGNEDLAGAIQTLGESLGKD